MARYYPDDFYIEDELRRKFKSYQLSNVSCISIYSEKSKICFENYWRNLANPNLIFAYIPYNDIKQELDDLYQNGVNVGINGFKFNIESLPNNCESVFRVCIALGKVNCYYTTFRNNLNYRTLLNGAQSLQISNSEYLIFEKNQIFATHIISFDKVPKLSKKYFISENGKSQFESSNVEVKKQVMNMVKKLFVEKLNTWRRELIGDFNEIFDSFQKIIDIFDNIFEGISKLITTMYLISKLKIEKSSTIKFESHINAISNIITAIKIYMNTMIKASKLEGKKRNNAIAIETSLFTMAFNYKKAKNEFGYISMVYPVYIKHDIFTSTNSSYLLFQSSTGSGKTRCAPFFFSSRIVFEGYKRPFFIMTQPSTAIAKMKSIDLKPIIKDGALIITSIEKMIGEYVNPTQSKPIIGIFSPINLLKIISRTEELKIDIFTKTRFCLDEIHERTIETDALLAKLSTEMKRRMNFEEQILLMSATPDEKVKRCFGRVEEISITDTTLFDVEVESKKIAFPKDAPTSVSESIFQIIQRISKNKNEHGHILCFLPGNQMIIEVMNQVNNMFKDDPNYVALNNNFIEENDRCEDVFIKLRTEVESNEDKIIIFPIKLAGFVPPEQKKVAQNPLPDNLDNKIIKIICATNAVESSITIQNLVAVIDSGLHNLPLNDIEKGITELKLEPITKKMQIQRKGRVGRTRPGISVQITLKDNELPENIPPSILTSDLSKSIISLRGAGIKLEELKGLPDDPGRFKFLTTIKELKVLKVIDNEGNLTEFGKETTQFQNISPSYSSAILETIKHYSISSRSLCKCLGALVVFIMTSNDIIGNSKSVYLQNNFCKHSDIVTVTKTFLDCIKAKGNKNIETISEYGFQIMRFTSIFQEMKRVFSCFLQNVNKFDCWKRLSNFVENIDFYGFVNILLSYYVRSRPKWYDAHKGKFYSVIGTNNHAKIMYHGDDSLKFDEFGPYIAIQERPGGKGLLTPKNIIVFNIQRNRENQRNYGSMIHSFDNSDFELETPYIIETEKFCFSDFFKLMLDAYTYEESVKDLFIKLCRNDSHMSGNTGEVFYLSMWKDKTIVSFIPKSENVIRECKNGVIISKSLMPFTPRSILIKNDIPNLVIEISVFGNAQYTTELHLLSNNENLPKCFNLTKRTMNFLYSKKLKDLASSANLYRIAITGELMSYSLDDEHKEVQSQSLRYIRDCETVFGKSVKSRIILMISNGEEMPNETSLKWIDRSIIAEYVEDEYISGVAGRIATGLIRSSHASDFFIIKNSLEPLIDGSHRPEISSGSNSFSKVITYLNREYSMGHTLLREIPIKLIKYFPTTVKNINAKAVDSKLANILKNNGIASSVFQLFGCTIVKTYSSIRSDQVNEMKSKISTFAKQSGLSVKEVEYIPITTLTVVHRETSRFTPEEFEKNVNSVTSRFHFLCKTNKYKPLSDTKSNQRGLIYIDVLDPYFAITVAGEIRKSIIGSNIQFRIPEKIVPRILLKEDSTISIIDQWILKNNLKNISREGFNFMGPPDVVKRAYEILKNQPDSIKLKFAYIHIPSTISRDDVLYIIKKANKNLPNDKKWKIDEYNNCLIVNIEDKDQANALLNRKKKEDADLFGCIQYCDEPCTSTSFVTLYKKDGSFESKHLCIDCFCETLKYATNRFYSDEGGVDFDIAMSQIERLENIPLYIDDNEKDCEIWPKCPIGQLFWALIKETKTRSVAKAWITGVAAQTLHAHPECCTFCPEHPSIILPLPKRNNEIRCSIVGCQNRFCKDCVKWHRENEACDYFKWEGMRCPGCHCPTIKSEGCNHISCRCGAHWCYKCGAGPFKTGGECYDHLRSEHGGYYDNNNS